MKTYDKSEELNHSDAEITLGTRSILGIFFGLALICGVFFGFGYSVGRGNASKAASQQTTSPAPGTAQPVVKTVVEGSSPTSDLSEDDADTDVAPPVGQTSDRPAQSNQAKPSAGSAVIPQTPVPAGTVSEDVARPVQTATAQSVPSIPAPWNASLPPVPAAAANSPSAPIMVQIAAVSHREDADVLISALKKLGYNASARSDTSDNLLHVQVGPFATRDEANVIRTKLLNDGYNAILK
jgi:DedD protein